MKLSPDDERISDFFTAFDEAEVLFGTFHRPCMFMGRCLGLSFPSSLRLSNMDSSTRETRFNHSCTATMDVVGLNEPFYDCSNMGELLQSEKNPSVRGCDYVGLS